MAYDPLTYRFPRTTNGLWPCNATEAVALHKYTKPRTTRFFYAMLKWGWVAVLMALFSLTGCDDLSAHAAVQAIINDGIHCDVVPHLQDKARAAIARATGEAA